MKFYDVSNTYQSLVHEVWALCDASISSYPLADVTRRVNAALEDLIGYIICADGTYQYDDTNHSTLPRGKGNLVEGQEAYSFASEYLAIEWVEILNKAGTRYERIKSIDTVDLGGLSPQEYFGTESDGSPKKGQVQYYDPSGDSIILYPAPEAASNTLTNGLRIGFKRTADLFTASDTSQEPGLPSTHHVILAYMAAIPYCMTYKKDRVPLYEKKVDEMKASLLKYYGLREKDRKKVMTPKRVLYV